MGNTVENEIIGLIADVSGYDVEEVKPEMNMMEELEVDSIKAIEITVALEKKFKIKIRDEDIPNITTVQQAIDSVKALIEKQALNPAGT